MPWTSCRSRWCSWWTSAWPSLRSSFPPVQALPCPTFWVCGPSLKDTHGRRLLYALLRCSAPVLCSREATDALLLQGKQQGTYQRTKEQRYQQSHRSGNQNHERSLAGRRLVNFPHTDNRQDYGSYGGHQRSQYRDPAHELHNVCVRNYPERGLETGISGLDDQGDQQVQNAGAYKQRYRGDDRRKEHRGY